MSVGFVQQILAELGYQVDVDGCLGPGTAVAIRQYQVASGLPVSGEIDTQTWQAVTVG